MRQCKVIVVLMVVILLPGVVSAQVRESGRLEVQAGRAQGGQAGIASTVPQSPLTRDSFSTNVTGAQVALGPGDLLEITVFDTPELAQRARVSSEGTISMPLIGEIAVRGLWPNE